MEIAPSSLVFALQPITKIADVESMKLLRSFIRVMLLAALGMAVAAAFAAPPISALPATSSATTPRVQGPVEDAERVVLHGNTHPLIQAAQNQSGTDLGAVEDSLPAGRMLLLLT
jgi:hypothetical protein